MPNYRRATGGCCYFFTVVTKARAPIFRDKQNVAILGDIVRELLVSRPFVIDAWVLLPEHLHAVWSLPENDPDFSMRWGWIKKEFTKKYREYVTGNALKSPWQPRFWEHMIRDQEDYNRHCDYVHYNPVKHGLVPAPSAWPHSTFHRFVREGKYSPDWGSTQITFADTIGNE